MTQVITSSHLIETPVVHQPISIHPRAKDIARDIAVRLQNDGRWSQVEPIKNAMIKEARAKGMTRDDAQRWAYGEVDRLYPPLPIPVITAVPKAEPVNAAGVPGWLLACHGIAVVTSSAGDGERVERAERATSARTTSQPAADSTTRLQGLGDVPASWPAMPDNASLATEIGWVQSQRLRIVEERGNTTIVHLDRARSPAPSWAALGWLETSIRSYAKFVDVVSRAAVGDSDEVEHVRREQLAIDEIKALLDEMHKD